MEQLFIDRIRTLSRPMEPQPTGVEPRLPDLSHIRAVIFDVYGTLFASGSGDIGSVSENPKVDALVESLREQGVEMPPELAESAMARFFELIALDHERSRREGTEYPEIRILDVWEHWRREAGVQVNVPQLAIDVECRINPVWPMPGLTTCLEELNRMGRVLGIVSNAQVFTPCLFPALTGTDLSGWGIEPGRCVWSWMRKEAKPSVRLYEESLRAFPDVDPSECLFVGNDMRNDISPAVRAGMRTALFAGDRRSLRLREGDPLVEGVQPDAVVTRLSDLLESL